MRKLTVLAIIASMPLMSLNASASDKCLSNGTITVSGSGQVQAMPDLAILSFSARHLDKDQKVARDSVEKTISTFVQTLEKAGIRKESIKADSLYLSPRYSYKDNVATLQGFEATRDITIETDEMASIGSIVDMAIDSGINEAAGFSYKVKDLKPYQDKATALAIADAKSKASILSKGFDVELGRPCSLSFSNYSQPSLYRSNGYRLMSSEKSDTQSTYMQNEMTINVEVNAIYSIN